MNNIKVQNYRAFKTEEEFKLADLSILVGRNGDGKSSLLRLFPLLKQSVMANSRAPFLWCGDLVDLGNFKNAKNNLCTEDENIILKFDLGDISPIFNEYPFFAYDFQLHYSSQTSFKDLGRLFEHSKLEFEISHSDKIGTYTKVVNAEFNENRIRLEFDEQGVVGISVNELNATDWFKVSSNSRGRIVPLVTFDSKRVQNEFYRSEFHGTPPANRLKTILSKYIRANTSEKVKNSIIDEIPFVSKHLLVKKLKKSTNDKYWNPSIDSMSEEVVDELYSLIITKFLSNILMMFEEYLRTIGGQVQYMMPVRAKVDRYYRQQELNVGDIDPGGANVPMFLDSLEGERLKSFKKWTKDIFGVEIYANKLATHIEIILKSQDREINLADTGYGYSQVLPIICQVWNFVNSDRRNFNKIGGKVPSYIVIEQPELHLHPEHQAKLAKLFVRAIKESKEKKQGLKFIIETHSEAIIEQIGREISKKKISQKDVSINIIEKLDGNSSTIKHSSFKVGGGISHWPIGFFGF